MKWKNILTQIVLWAVILIGCVALFWKEQPAVIAKAVILVLVCYCVSFFSHRKKRQPTRKTEIF